MIEASDVFYWGIQRRHQTKNNAYAQKTMKQTKGKLWESLWNYSSAFKANQLKK